MSLRSLSFRRNSHFYQFFHGFSGVKPPSAEKRKNAWAFIMGCRLEASTPNPPHKRD